MTKAFEPTAGSNHILVTGCTGLLGRYLMKDLLLAGVPLALLARPARRQSASARIDAILGTWERQLEHSLPRPKVLEGNLSDETLGLTPESRDWISDHCHSVLHNAASLSFVSAPRDVEPWKTNLTGTSHLLNLCRESGIENFHHVSTAYVCGARQDIISEQELDQGQQLCNDYECSKLEAEKLIRQSSFLKSTTVFRPSIIVGDSETGFSTTFHGFYAALQMSELVGKGMQLIPEGQKKPQFRINLDGTERKNLVPVNWVSAVISHVLSNQELHNQTYHLTPQEPVTMAMIIDVLTTVSQTREAAQLVGSQTPIENPNELESLFYESMKVYGSYWKNDPTFDNSNTLNAAPHLPCPMIDEDCLMMLAKAAVEQDFRWRDEPSTSEINVTG